MEIATRMLDGVKAVQVVSDYQTRGSSCNKDCDFFNQCKRSVSECAGIVYKIR
jgi:hypothetical protein